MKKFKSGDPILAEDLNSMVIEINHTKQILYILIFLVVILNIIIILR